MAKSKRSIKIDKNSLPKYCDYSCMHAEFSDPNAVGACRKELAVWCSLLKKYNNKNNRCLVE